MTARLARIFRYPVKAIGGEELDEVSLTAGQPLPGDRRFAVLHGDMPGQIVDGALHRWLPKTAFLRGAAAASLQAVRGGWHEEMLVLTHPERPTLRFDPAGDDGPLIDWLEPLWADSGKAPAARLAEGPQALTDMREPYVSILSLSSLAAVESRLGRPLGLPRWRANLWIDGWPPFHENELKQMPLRIGKAEFKVRSLIGRCAATSANTDTGRLDGDMPRELTAAFHSADFGIYAEVTAPGAIRPGDRVELL
ncbi:MAG TPA: MOSC domain-containing protein [Paracoccus sp. (in: a-proteobacteria)]|nr:MOSC domain-containing protein [Paracoccus sp. (in: a-proteobacteria)]